MKKDERLAVRAEFADDGETVERAVVEVFRAFLQTLREA